MCINSLAACRHLSSLMYAQRLRARLLDRTYTLRTGRACLARRFVILYCVPAAYLFAFSNPANHDTNLQDPTWY